MDRILKEADIKISYMDEMEVDYDVLYVGGNFLGTIATQYLSRL